MSLRANLVLSAVYFSLPWIPFFPFYGLLVYTWIAFMRPHDLAWGIERQQIGLYVALVLLLGLGIAIVQGREKLMAWKIQNLLLIALLAWFWWATYNAIAYNPAKHELDLFAKVALISLVTTGLVNTEKRFRLIFLVTAISLGLLGFKYGLFGLLRGGADFDEGPGGFMKDNNGFAVGLNMALPLLVGIAIGEKSKWLRFLGAVLAAFCVITIIFTFSRGGFLSLAVVSCVLLVRTKKRFLAVLVMILGVATVVMMTPENFQEKYQNRVETIAEYQEDGSAMGRIDAWRTALRVFEDNPWTGVGPDNFMIVYQNYDTSSQVRVSHNAFLQLLAEAGLPAAALWVTLILVTGWKLEKMRKIKNPASTAYYASAIQLSIVAYIVGSLFLDKAIFDLLYHLIALSVALEVIVEQASELPVPEADVADDEPWWRKPAVSPAQPST